MRPISNVDHALPWAAASTSKAENTAIIGTANVVVATGALAMTSMDIAIVPMRIDRIDIDALEASEGSRRVKQNAATPSNNA